MVTDLVGEMVFLVTMKIKLCFNDPTPCDLQEIILLNTKLPKPECPWFTGYPNPSMYIYYHIALHHIIAVSHEDMLFVYLSNIWKFINVLIVCQILKKIKKI
jgi:hypothetical protein